MEHYEAKRQRQLTLVIAGSLSLYRLTPPPARLHNRPRHPIARGVTPAAAGSAEVTVRHRRTEQGRSPRPPPPPVPHPPIAAAGWSLLK